MTKDKEKAHEWVVLRCTKLGVDTAEPRDISMLYDIVLSSKSWRKERWCSFSHTSCIAELCFPGDYWTPAWWWKCVNSVFLCVCVCNFCFTYWISTCLSTCGFHAYPSSSLLHPTWRVWECEHCVGLICLPRLATNREEACQWFSRCVGYLTAWFMWMVSRGHVVWDSEVNFHICISILQGCFFRKRKEEGELGA